MDSFQTKPTSEAEAAEVNAGQWWRLTDMPDLGIVGDGGEARGVLLGEAEEILFRLYPSDWVVESSPEVFERFTNAEFNDHFRMLIKDSAKLSIGGGHA